MLISRYFWISIFLALSSGILAQEQVTKLPKEKKSFIPTGVRMGANLVRPTRTIFDDGYNSWGVAGDVDFYRFILELGYGREKVKNTDGEFAYKTNGDFLRMGVDANFISNPDKGNALMIGLKYVFANYTEELSFDQISNFGTREVTLSNNEIPVRWTEFNFGIKGKVISNLHAGFYIRFKVFKSISDDLNFQPYQIPGFGLGAEDSRAGFDYYIMWRIPFKKPIEK